MDMIQVITGWIWEWSRTVFGTIFVVCMLMSLLFLVIELFLYRIKTDDGMGSSCSIETENELDAGESTGYKKGERK